MDAPLHRVPYDYSCANWYYLHGDLIDVPWVNIFKLDAPAAACEWV